MTETTLPREDPRAHLRKLERRIMQGDASVTAEQLSAAQAAAQAAGRVAELQAEGDAQREAARREAERAAKVERIAASVLSVADVADGMVAVRTRYAEMTQAMKAFADAVRSHNSAVDDIVSGARNVTSSRLRLGASGQITAVQPDGTEVTAVHLPVDIAWLPAVTDATGAATGWTHAYVRADGTHIYQEPKA